MANLLWNFAAMTFTFLLGDTVAGWSGCAHFLSLNFLDVSFGLFLSTFGIKKKKKKIRTKSQTNTWRDKKHNMSRFYVSMIGDEIVCRRCAHCLRFLIQSLPVLHSHWSRHVVKICIFFSLQWLHNWLHEAHLSDSTQDGGTVLHFAAGKKGLISLIPSWDCWWTLSIFCNHVLFLWRWSGGVSGSVSTFQKKYFQVGGPQSPFSISSLSFSSSSYFFSFSKQN